MIKFPHNLVLYVMDNYFGSRWSHAWLVRAYYSGGERVCRPQKMPGEQRMSRWRFSWRLTGIRAIDGQGARDIIVL